MGVLTCVVPSFPLALLARAEPSLVRHPVALVGPDERVLDASAPARSGGVSVGQTARQARVALPEVDVRPVDLAQCEAEFDTLLALLDDFTDAVEPSGLGQAYLNLPHLSDTARVALCQDVGRRIRHEFGAALTPAIGCNHSKFTAQIAARHSRPGAVRVVHQSEQRAFLAPFSVRLLPLPDEQSVQLGLLGIQRLGEYADLPPRAVLQQFGKTGRLAQQWARGEDDRPIVPRQKRPVLTVAASFDPPLEAAPALVLDAIRLLKHPLASLAEAFQGACRMSSARTYTTGASDTDTWTFPTPTADPQRLQRLLAGRWQARAWPAPVSGLTITLSQIQDVWGEQRTLFDLDGGADTPALLAHLRLRYGPKRVRLAALGNLLDGRVERRVAWHDGEADAVA